MSRLDRTYHNFRSLSATTALCGCGVAFMGSTTLEEQRSRWALHLMEMERFESERDEQRAAEAAEYGDPKDLYNRQDAQRTAQAITLSKKKKGRY